MEGKRRYIINVIGVVQGVGFRPLVYNLASLFHITGWVSNHGGMLVMDIEGYIKNLRLFLSKIIKEPPKLAVIKKIKIIKEYYIGYDDFKILPSQLKQHDNRFIPNDISTCSECLNELLEMTNRRYRYPFTNCTSCGPRYSIIKQLPYDRINTTMEKFIMCPTCQSEYENPNNRRFHAQPNGCPQCGPKLKLLNNTGEEILCEDMVEETIRLLKKGNIIALKGLGGFHLACDAMNQKAIELLRQRKNRPHKPFAVMIKDINFIKTLCELSQEEEKSLVSNKSPIVLIKKKNSNYLPDQIAPQLNTLGIMLPYTPLHHLLFESDIKALVMTSANKSSSPIEYNNHQAIHKLHSIADFFLVHDRDIYMPIEDSVVKVINHCEVVVRSGRGYSPFSINLDTNDVILALGIEEKGNFAFSYNGYAYLSQYLGDLKDYDAYSNYLRVIEHFKAIMGFSPMIIAHDIRFEPSYKGEKVVAIQHHHAHMVSCMVEHGLNENTIGVIFDGTGIGTDGTIWGGELFIGNRKEYTRVGHFKNVLIQGGDTSIRDVWKIAYSYLYAMNIDPKKWIKGISDTQDHVIRNALKNKFNCYSSSSLGRLFDCIFVLLIGCHHITYQAQGAIELESIINPVISDSYKYDINEQKGNYEVEYKEIIKGILNDIELGIPHSDISAKFHNTIGTITIDLVTKISHIYHINDVVISGGVFENNYLLTYILNGTRDNHLNIYYNQKIPINDGGISIGQLAIAAAKERE